MKIPLKYSNYNDVSNNKNFKLFDTIKVEVYAALYAEVDIYIGTNDKHPSDKGVWGVLDIKWNQFSEWSKPHFRTICTVHTIIPYTKRDLNLYLNGLREGWDTGKRRVSSNLVSDEELNIIKSIRDYVKTEKEEAIEDFKDNCFN